MPQHGARFPKKMAAWRAFKAELKYCTLLHSLLLDPWVSIFFSPFLPPLHGCVISLIWNKPFFLYNNMIWWYYKWDSFHLTWIRLFLQTFVGIAGSSGAWSSARKKKRHYLLWSYSKLIWTTLLMFRFHLVHSIQKCCWDTTEYWRFVCMLFKQQQESKDGTCLTPLGLIF